MLRPALTNNLTTLFTTLIHITKRTEGDWLSIVYNPVFRRSTRNVPEFLLRPFQHCSPQYLKNAYIYKKNLCPFRAFFY